MYENRAEMQSLRTFCVTEQWRSAAPTDVRAFALVESGSESGFSLIQDF